MPLFGPNMKKLESISATLGIADDWEKKKQPVWVHGCLSSALLSYLSLAVTEHANALDGIAWMRSQGVAPLLNRDFTVLRELAESVDAGKSPSSVIAGNYPELVFAHLAWCFADLHLGEAFVAFSERPDVCELSTKFWREYARGMGALVRGQQFQPKDMPLRGLEKHWFLYLKLIEAANSAQPLEQSRAEIDNAFIARNKDKRIKQDAYSIEGSGSLPVRWDFRFHGLLEYIKKRAG